MKGFFTAFAIGASSLALLLAMQLSREIPRHVQAGENRLRMSIAGQGSPAVVFECFGPAYLEVWNRIQPEVARFTRTVSYDHGGYWGSEPGRKPRDARQIVRELRYALARANVRPPYVLVGYSFGGPYARVFAGLHPGETAGLVLVDPTQEEVIEWLEKTFPDLTAVSARHLEAEDELANRWRSMDLARELPVPEVPLTLITGLKHHDPLGRYLMPRWLEAHQTWLKPYPHARHIVTTNSGDGLVLTEPQLVIEAIRSVVQEVRLAKDQDRSNGVME